MYLIKMCSNLIKTGQFGTLGQSVLLMYTSLLKYFNVAK